MKTVEVLFTPADFSALYRRKLDRTLCVVFDVFRATSVMVTALANRATAIIPVDDIPSAINMKHQLPSVLLAGERDGLRIRARVSGGTEFDLGNSPREFTREKVAGKTIVMTTTNGTHAMRSCSHAKSVVVGSFLNLQATAHYVEQEEPDNLLLVCGGTHEQAAYEDVLCAGALCDLLWKDFHDEGIADSTKMARALYHLAAKHLLSVASQSRNGMRLSRNPELRDDVPYCLQKNLFAFAAGLNRQGKVQKV